MATVLQSMAGPDKLTGNAFSYGGVPKWLRERSAKPPFTGSNPVAALWLQSGVNSPRRAWRGPKHTPRSDC